MLSTGHLFMYEPKEQVKVDLSACARVVMDKKSDLFDQVAMTLNELDFLQQEAQVVVSQLQSPTKEYILLCEIWTNQGSNKVAFF